jgi:hypothetical protein
VIRCFRDEDGVPRVDAGDLPHVVATFLEQDVQGSLAYSRELLALLEDVASGRLPAWRGTGNAHTVTIEPSGVTIENEWSEPGETASVSFEAFGDAVRAWIRMLGGEDG